MGDVVVTRAHRMAAELAYSGQTRDELEAELRNELEPEELGEMERWRDTGEMEEDHDPEVGGMMNRIALAIAAEGMREREACAVYAVKIAAMLKADEFGISANWVNRVAEDIRAGEHAKVST